MVGFILLRHSKYTLIERTWLQNVSDSELPIYPTPRTLICMRLSLYSLENGIMEISLFCRKQTLHFQWGVALSLSYMKWRIPLNHQEQLNHSFLFSHTWNNGDKRCIAVLDVVEGGRPLCLGERSPFIIDKFVKFTGYVQNLKRNARGLNSISIFKNPI